MHKILQIVILLLAIISTNLYGDRRSEWRRPPRSHPIYPRYYSHEYNPCHVYRRNVIVISPIIYRIHPIIYETPIIHNNDVYPNQNQIIMINVPNSNSSFTSVPIENLGNGYYKGPKGEIYSGIPTIYQLRCYVF